MSCFLVSDTAIQKIVSASQGWFADYDHPIYHKICGDSTNDADRLGSDLLHLNERAFDARYAETPVATAFRWEMKRYPVLVCIKAMDCWLYQCAEGDVYKSALYSHVEQLRNELLRGVVSRLPEYKAASWGD